MPSVITARFRFHMRSVGPGVPTEFVQGAFQKDSPVPSEGSERPAHPRSAVSGRISAEEFRTMMGRTPENPRGIVGRIRRMVRGRAPKDSQKLNKQLPSVSAADHATLPLRWVLPFVPPSVNGLFHSVTDEESGRPKRVLTRKARNLRKAIQTFVKGALPSEEPYELRVTVELPALTKEGKLRKVDLTNRIKFLEDCIAQCLGIDDRQFFRVVLDKLHADHERTIIEIHPYKDNQQRHAA